MKTPFSLVGLLLYTSTILSQTESSGERIKYFTEKAENYLDKEKSLSGYYSIDEKSISMYASKENKIHHNAEFTLSYEQLNDFRREVVEGHAFEFYKKGSFDPFETRIRKNEHAGRKDKKLNGLKVAIDPGHIAGDHVTGELEKKHICFAKDSLKGLFDSVEISEGMLTYATAMVLKAKLEAGGAQVKMTRECNGCSAFGNTYPDWKKKDYKKAVDTLYKTGRISLGQKKFFLGSAATDRDIFRVIFRDLELQERGKIINNFAPDIAVVIHYNVDETNLEWQKPSTKNNNMCFVGGSFMKGDLSTKEKRFEFLRLLVTEDLDKSIRLSGYVIGEFEDVLQVPSAGINDAGYLREGCMPAGPKGVYCRNLQLPRYIHCPVVYGETLYQDNLAESQALNKEKDKTKNERVRQVAEAYYRGILKYLETP
jgi:N-acetylmuramoyl-L-alanine amidase